MPNILYFGQLEYGHMIFGITMRELFKKRFGDEYQIYYVVDDHWNERLKKIDPAFNTLVLKPVHSARDNEEDEAFDLLANSFGKCRSLREQCETIVPTVHKFFVNSSKHFRLIQPQIDQLFKQIDFQLIVIDSCLPVPFLMNKNIPYVLVVTMSINALSNGYDIPPPCSDITFADRHDRWPKRVREMEEQFVEFVEMHNKYLDDERVDPALRLKPGKFMFPHPYLNIYLAPEEISYICNDTRDAIEKPNAVRLEHEWIRIDSTIDNSIPIEPYQLPKWFLELPGKTIYFSLGSNFCKNTTLMQKILDVLGELPHRFIVSTGSNGDRIKLPANCYGDKWLPQKSVLKVCDMMITHAGNNSLTECFHFGVPMLALPLFVDQLNNAVRLEECGYGYKVDVFDFKPDELRNGILKVLNDHELKEKMAKASKRIQNDNGVSRACNAMVQLIKKFEKCEKSNGLNSMEYKAQTEV